MNPELNERAHVYLNNLKGGIYIIPPFLLIDEMVTNRYGEERVDWNFSPAILYFNTGNENFHNTVKVMGNELKELSSMNNLEKQKDKIRLLLDKRNLKDMGKIK